jgi:hypothetical protein
MDKVFKHNKPIVFLFLIVGIVISCSKADEVVSNYDYYLNVFINNVKYSTNNVSTFVQPNQTGCVVNKPYTLTNVGQINVDSFFLDVYIKHYSRNVDFASVKPGNHKIYDGGQLLSGTNCNCDLAIGLVDNSIPTIYNNTILQSTNIVNNITSIKKKDSTELTMTYIVNGNFSCNFKNTKNVIIPVVGTFSIPIKVTK